MIRSNKLHRHMSGMMARAAAGSAQSVHRGPQSPVQTWHTLQRSAGNRAVTQWVRQLVAAGGTAQAASKVDKNKPVKASKTKKAIKKAKAADGKPDGYLGRRADAGVGKRVDFKKDRKFRTERRLRRKIEGRGKGRNFYVVSYIKDGKKFRVATVSQPPGGLPKDHAAMSEEKIASMTFPGHSEKITDNIEGNYAPTKDAKRKYEATTREQCESCRHHFPSKAPGEHVYGFPYSAQEDHIHDDKLHDMIKKNKGIKGKLKLTDKQNKELELARDSATYARQNEPDQNPLLMSEIDQLGDNDSDGGFSSDEDEVHISPAIRQQLGPAVKLLGKAKLVDIPPEFTLSDDQMGDQKKWIEEMKKAVTKKIEKKAKEKKTLGKKGTDNNAKGKKTAAAKK